MNTVNKDFLKVLSITISIISILTFQAYSSARQTNPSIAKDVSPASSAPEDRSIARAVELLGKNSPPSPARVLPARAAGAVLNDDAGKPLEVPAICPICLDEPVKKHGKYIKTICCGEIRNEKMCRPCVVEWIAQEKDTCPICRANGFASSLKLYDENNGLVTMQVDIKKALARINSYWNMHRTMEINKSYGLSNTEREIYGLFVDIVERVKILGFLLAKKEYQGLTNEEQQTVDYVQSQLKVPNKGEEDILLAKGRSLIYSDKTESRDAFFTIFSRICKNYIKKHPASDLAKRDPKGGIETYTAVLEVVCGDIENLGEYMTLAWVDKVILLQADLLSRCMIMETMKVIFPEYFDFAKENNKSMRAHHENLKNKLGKKFAHFWKADVKAKA